MKTKVTSVLLCVLLSSSLGHDYHRAKNIAHQNRRSHHLSHFHERQSTLQEQQCTWTCNDTANVPGGTLDLLVNVTISLVGLVNSTAEVALVLDLEAGLLGLFNGSSGDILIINIATGDGVYVTQNQCDLSWLSSQISFELHFRNLPSLKVILDLNVGTKFNASSASEAILELVANLLTHLSVSLGLQIGGQLKLSLTLLLNLSQTLSTLLNGPLNGLLGLVGRLVIHLGGDLQWLLQVLEGLNVLLSEIPGGLSGLLKAKVELDIALLLSATDGVELLVNFLLAVVTRLDLGVLSNILNNLENLLSVLVKLGGGASWGINGVLKVVSSIVSLLQSDVSIDVVINALIEFAASRSTGIDLSVSIQALDSVIRIQTSLHSPSNISGLISIVENLENGTLTVGNINISAILNLLIEGASDGIELIVRVLLSLSDVVKSAVAIPRLLLNLITSLNTSLGVHLVESLLPGISIKVNPSGGVDWKETLGGINIAQILRYIATGDIDGLLSSLPIVKNIYVAVRDAVSHITNGSVNLKGLLNAAGSIVKELISVITGLLGISGLGGQGGQGGVIGGGIGRGDQGGQGGVVGGGIIIR